MLNYDDGVRCEKLGFAETELRLGIGLPGDAEKCNANYGKRGYAETVDLKLNLDRNDNSSLPDRNHLCCPNFSVKSPAKAQAVGWPPVRSFRKNAMAVQQKSSAEETGAGAFVKVSMDGAPYLRKVDLKMYKTYKELSEGLAKMFSTFTTTTGKCDSQGMVDFMNEKKAMESEYVPTYEDKDGDWMLVGDVPWEMFVESCKRMRIMKGADAKGLAAPKTSEKCKSRN